MFSSVLIANRGEIACRIARTAKRLGMRTIAVYSDADADALHVRLCDEAHPIGPAPARDSYLRIDTLIAVAAQSGAQCVHPGYGFLSENAEFAESCAAAAIAFVGPPPAAIRAMGLKDRAKILVEKAGVPVVLGFHGDRQDPKFLKEKAYEIGYPILIKAVAGGGGKGMRRVDKHSEFDTSLEAAQREAQSSFGDSRVLIEKYIVSPRHIEFQIFADTIGNTIHLNERDCSLQRRHQKVIEEAPAPGMTPDLRARIGAQAVNCAKAAGYVGAGTVEFIADGALKNFYFLEMNTRLQVEHPVTEAITGLDLVEWQFRIAAGEGLPIAQNEVPCDGHAVEARVYAEDPEHGFLPSTGKLVALRFPDGKGIRVDTGVVAGGDITPFYDPMIAKVIVHAGSRKDALARLAAALDATVAAGPRTNLAFLAALCRSPEFMDGAVETGFIDSHLADLGAVAHAMDDAAAARGIARLLERDAELGARGARRADQPASPWDADDGFQISGPREMTRSFIVDGQAVEARIAYGPGGATLSVNGAAPDFAAAAVETPDAIHVLRRGRQTIVKPTAFDAAGEDSGGDGVVRAPMHGKVIALLVETGHRVTAGQRLAVIEAMKMEHALVARGPGIIADIAIAVGQQVVEGARLMSVKTEAESQVE